MKACAHADADADEDSDSSFSHSQRALGACVNGVSASRNGSGIARTRGRAPPRLVARASLPDNFRARSGTAAGYDDRTGSGVEGLSRGLCKAFGPSGVASAAPLWASARLLSRRADALPAPPQPPAPPTSPATRWPTLCTSHLATGRWHPPRTVGAGGASNGRRGRRTEREERHSGRHAVHREWRGRRGARTVRAAWEARGGRQEACGVRHTHTHK